MSHQSLKSSKTSNLPRRRFLQAMTAALPAAVILPKPRQAFSTPSIPPIRDRRLAKVDRLIAKINQTCVAQSALSERDDDEGKDLFEAASQKWFTAQDALSKYADKIASAAEPMIADALVLAKIADFQIVNAGGDIDISGNERSVPMALRAILTAHGIAPTERTAMTDAQEELEAAIASQPPRPEPRLYGAAAGDLIARIRGLARAKNAALVYEGRLDDDTPAANRAQAVTDARLAELEELRDEILTGLKRPADQLHLDDTYHLSPIEEFAVLFELVDAFGPWNWDSRSSHGGAAPVLSELHRIATCRSDDYLDAADRQNARGGAHV